MHNTLQQSPQLLRDLRTEGQRSTLAQVIEGLGQRERSKSEQGEGGGGGGGRSTLSTAHEVMITESTLQCMHAFCTLSE